MPRMREAVSIVCEARGRLTLPEGLKAAMPGAFRGNPGGRMTASRIDAVPLPLASAGLSARAGVSVRPRPLPSSAASCERKGMAGRAAISEDCQKIEGRLGIAGLAARVSSFGRRLPPVVTLSAVPRKAVRIRACPRLCARGYSCTVCALPHECGLLCVPRGRRLCQKD